MSDFQLCHAARWSKGLPHQDDAWNWLQTKLPPNVLHEFKLRYRNEYRVQSLTPQFSVPQQAINLIKDIEKFKSSPYLCSEKIPTIGFGTTIYPDGRCVTLSDRRITLQEAEDYLLHHIKTRILPTLHESIPFWASMSENQRSALISFAYNAGENFMLVKSGYNTIQSHLMRRAWNLVPEALMIYINPGTESTEGLKKRRQLESELWQGKGKYAKS